MSSLRKCATRSYQILPVHDGAEAESPKLRRRRSALACQKRPHCSRNPLRTLQKDVVVAAVEVDDRVLRKPRKSRPRVGDDGVYKLEQCLRAGAATFVELRVVRNHVGHGVRYSIDGERTAVGLIISGYSRAARDSRLERVDGHGTEVSARRIESKRGPNVGIGLVNSHHARVNGAEIPAMAVIIDELGIFHIGIEVTDIAPEIPIRPFTARRCPDLRM